MLKESDWVALLLMGMVVIFFTMPYFEGNILTELGWIATVVIGLFASVVAYRILIKKVEETK